MKLLTFLIMSLAISVTASASSTTLYYVGEAITTTDSGVVRHPYIIARTSDPIAGTIAESVVSYQRSKFVENSSIIKIVNGHFTMSESTGTVSGSGDLTGTPWNWTFLRAEFRAPNYRMRIVDYNFFADPNSVMGHKDFYVSNTTGGEDLVMQEDVALHLVDKVSFEAKRSELLGQH